MERNNSKVNVFFMKILKILLAPISRLRKIMRKSNMRQIKFSVGVVALISCIATIYYFYHLSTAVTPHIEEFTPKGQLGTPFRHVPLNEIYKQLRNNGVKDYILDTEDHLTPALMVDTPGCKIPLAMVEFERYTRDYSKIKDMKLMACGKRAIFLRKIGDYKVIAHTKTLILEKYAKNIKEFVCCHRFIIDSIQYPHERPKLRFSNCTKFQDEALITLQSDFMNIRCSGYDSKNISRIIYDDMYAFTKKINITKRKKKEKSCKTKYNVLMLGMDSMSLPRAVKTMPRTTAFLKNENWLGFRGYHKIGDNTFPNLMAVLTGKNLSAITKRCSDRMDECNDFIIWNAFKEAGYVTAYGEDYLQLPDTFTKEYTFRYPPTDHYMRPFFLKGESKQQNNSLLCAGKSSSGQQLLDYALDFANTYKKDSFFGLFWMNSFSHDEKSHPEDVDKIIENFLNQLTYTGVMVNTFVIFFSDHGIRFGAVRSKMESYYDDRMPMNFIWLPHIFKGTQPYELRAIAINQFRLITPYDIYSTLLDIKKISLCTNITDPVPEGCPKCHTMFQVITSNRTCPDAAINDKWCSCHKLFPLPIQDSIGIKSVELVVNHIKTKVETIETQHCWGCMSLSLKKIVRIHFYYGRDKISLFYVVAFNMTPGNVTYEATVMRENENYEYSIVGPISAISNYRGLGKCAFKRKDRLFCICQKKDNC